MFSHAMRLTLLISLVAGLTALAGCGTKTPLILTPAPASLSPHDDNNAPRVPQ